MYRLNRCVNSLPHDNMQIAHETFTMQCTTFFYFSSVQNFSQLCAVDAGDIYHTACTTCNVFIFTMQVRVS